MSYTEFLNVAELVIYGAAAVFIVVEIVTGNQRKRGAK